MTRARSFVSAIAAVALLFAVVVGVKGISLMQLSSATDTRLSDVASFYGIAIKEATPSLLAELPSATDNDRSAVQTLAQSAPEGADRISLIKAIVKTQKSFTTLTESVQEDEALASEPAYGSLTKKLRKNGDVQHILDTYNTFAQRWNNEQDDPLGRWYFRALHLSPRLLLNADGRTEYQTTVTL